MTLPAPVAAKLEQVQTQLRQHIENPNLRLEINVQALDAIPDADNQKRNVLDFFEHSGLSNSIVPAIRTLTTNPAGKAWLQQLAGVMTFVPVAAPQQNSDLIVQAALATTTPPSVNFTFHLRTSRSLRSAYNSRAVQEAILTAVPQLRTGQSMDAVVQSGKIEQVQTELRRMIEHPHLVINWDLFSIANMASGDECKNASDWLAHAGFTNSMLPAFRTLTANQAGKAWLQRIPVINCMAISEPQQNTDLVVECGAQDGVAMNFMFHLRTSRSLRSAYNSRAVQDSVTRALPMLLTGQDIDKINNSGKINKVQEELRTLIGNPDIIVNFDLFTVTNMPQQECHNAAEFISEAGFINSMVPAVRDLAKIPSGKAWLARFGCWNFSMESCPQQNTDLVVEASQVAECGALNFLFRVRTSRSLRSGYNSRAVHDAIQRAIPELLAGADADKIQTSGKIVAVEAQLREHIENPNIAFILDVEGLIATENADERKHMTEFVTEAGMSNTLGPAVRSLCNTGPRAKNTLGGFTSWRLQLVSQPAASTDLTVLAVDVSQPPVLALSFGLRSSRSLRSGYNSRALEDALKNALPLRQCADLDAIEKSESIPKLEAAIREVTHNANVTLVVDYVNSLQAMQSVDEFHNAAEWVIHAGMTNTFKPGFTQLARKANFASIFGNVQQLQVRLISNPSQGTDCVCDVAAMQGGIAQITVSLRTSRSLRSGYNSREFEQKFAAAYGVQ